MYGDLFVYELAELNANVNMPTYKCVYCAQTLLLLPFIEYCQKQLHNYFIKFCHLDKTRECRNNIS